MLYWHLIKKLIMDFLVFSKIICPLLFINIVTALLKSTTLNMENIGLKDSRNIGVIAGVLNMYGFLMCAKQCEKLNRCTGFNYMRSELICELLTSFGKIANIPGWRFVNISSVLEDNTFSTQQSGKICKTGERSIPLTSGSVFCSQPDYPIDCGDSARMPPGALSDVYKITPKKGANKLTVFCDMDTDGSGWTIIQKRTNGDVDFNKDWNTYKNGFGDLIGEHWLGNEALYTLTSAHDYILKIEMTTVEGEYLHATYSEFLVADAYDDFKLTISGYSGNETDALSLSSGIRFSTIDRDNGPYANNCSASVGGGWWFGGCCENANLNEQHTSCSGCVNVYWKPDNFDVKSVTMKIQRKE